MNTFKTNKGITLVALIITIIVLLILTVVAISSITDQGLFTKSQEAVNSYEDSRKEEEGKLAGYASEINKYLGNNVDGVKAYQLPELLGGGVALITPEENTTYVFANTAFPTTIQLIDITEDNSYNIDVSELGAKKDYKILTNGEIVFALTKDRNEIYISQLNVDNSAKITKDLTAKRSDDLLTKYYHVSTENCKYFGRVENDSGLLWVIKDTNEEKSQQFILCAGDMSQNNKKNIEIGVNEKAFNIKLDGKDYTIREGAKKIINNSISAYIQDDILIFGSLSHGITENIEVNSEEGTLPLIKFFDSSILELE